MGVIVGDVRYIFNSGKRNLVPSRVVFGLTEDTAFRRAALHAVSTMANHKPIYLLNQDDYFRRNAKLLSDKRSAYFSELRSVVDGFLQNSNNISCTRKSKENVVKQLQTEKIKLQDDLRKLELKVKIKVKERTAIQNLLEEDDRTIALGEEEVSNLKCIKNELVMERSQKDKEFEEISRAFITAIIFNKSRLNCSIDLDDKQDSFCFTFFKTDTEAESRKYFVELASSNDAWQLLKMQPTLPCERILKARLQESGDIQGFLSHVRHLFLQYAAANNDNVVP